MKLHMHSFVSPFCTCGPPPEYAPPMWQCRDCGLFLAQDKQGIWRQVEAPLVNDVEVPAPDGLVRDRQTWARGYAAALALAWKMRRDVDVVVNGMRVAGLSLLMVKESGAFQSDCLALQEAVDELERRGQKL